jgi:hypothetical protein
MVGDVKSAARLKGGNGDCPFSVIEIKELS